MNLSGKSYEILDKLKTITEEDVRVFVLGAGSSHQCSFVTHGDECLPLLADLLEALRLQESEYLKYFGISNAIHRYFPSHRRQSWNDISIEELMSLLEIDASSDT